MSRPLRSAGFVVVAGGLLVVAGVVGTLGGAGGAGGVDDTDLAPWLDRGSNSSAGTPSSATAPRPLDIEPEPTGVATPDGPAIVAVYPNPVPAGDPGEFVALWFPADAPTGNYTLGDGEDRVAVEPPAGGGLVRLSTAPDRTRELGFENVRGIEDHFALANGGERLTLRRDGALVASHRYGHATESAVHRRVRDEPPRWRWVPVGSRRHPVATASGVDATAFVLPDAPRPAVPLVRNATDRVYLAGYTFGSWPLARALADASARGVEVRVLLEGGPVGGISARQHRQLTFLAARGVDVRVVEGPRARITYHHAKYAVVDDRAVVLTENWKPAGTGGRSSRGWGVELADPAVAAQLAGVFRDDAGWLDAKRWATVAGSAETVEDNASDASYPRRFEPREMRVQWVHVATTPGPGDELISRLIGSADRSVRIQQVSIGSRHFDLLEATVAAARRGVRVRILLSGAWYVEADNRELADRLEALAAREGLDLRVRLVDPRGRFEKTHVKGVIVDRETVVLGSLNWNHHAATGNREVVVALTGEAVGAYYARVFDADWRAGGRRLPATVGLALVAAVVGAARLAGRVRFGQERVSEVSHVSEVSEREG